MKTAMTVRRSKGAVEAKPTLLPYGRHTIVEEDIRAVEEVLRSDWLTQGPTVEKFERAVADTVGAKHVVACSNGTAALHLAVRALRLKPGDVVVTTPNTFVADANCARYVGADVQFVDIDPSSGIMSVDALEEKLRKDTTKSIKAIVVVHFAGQPADMERIAALARRHGTQIIEDACHAFGATYQIGSRNVKVGSCEHSDMTVFSFHPVKHVTTGEGGAISTNDPDLAARLKMLRTHGITRDGFVESEMASDSEGATNLWYYEMQELGFNYRLTDIQAALGLSQISRLQQSLERRNELASRYLQLLEERFADGEVRPLQLRQGCYHAYHLFVIQIDFARLHVERNALMRRLKERHIGAQVHYIPIHLQPYYRNLYGHKQGDYPHAEHYYSQTLSIPMYPALTNEDIDRVVNELAAALDYLREGR